MTSLRHCLIAIIYPLLEISELVTNNPQQNVEYLPEYVFKTHPHIELIAKIKTGLSVLIAHHEMEFKQSPAKTVYTQTTPTGLIANLVEKYRPPLFKPSESLTSPFGDIIPEGATASPEMYEKHSVCEAPTVSEILNGPLAGERSKVPFFTNRNGIRYGFEPIKPLHTDLKEARKHKNGHGSPVLGNYDGRPVLEDFSEADALYDLMHKMYGVVKVLETYLHAKPNNNSNDRDKVKTAISVANDIRTELRFIGTEELDKACEGLADYWFDRLESGKELFLGIEKQASSSTLICSLILEKLKAKHDPENSYADRIHPVYLEDISVGSQLPKYASAIKQNGLILIDDWVISGSQMMGLVNSIMSIPKSSMEINYVCATDKLLKNGLAGVPVRAYFSRPYRNSFTENNASITGTHCPTDYGFNTELGRIYEALEIACIALDDAHDYDSYLRYPWPIMSGASTSYRENDLRNYKELPRKWMRMLWRSAEEYNKRAAELRKSNNRLLY